MIYIENNDIQSHKRAQIVMQCKVIGEGRVIKDVRSVFVSSGNPFLLADSFLDGHVNQFVSSFFPQFFESMECFFVINGKFKITFQGSIFQNGANEIVVFIDVGNFVFVLGDVGDLDGGGGGGGIFVFLSGEDVNSDDGGFSGSMLSWLGGGVLGHFAGVVLEHAVAALLDLAGSGGSAV